ncbi:Os02g0575350 [Oryza sativa Japonica Group]|uniref:Os02g0575350 protein n=1 Tax=Oryza sativa subsp. japonica TaxID=39947 RepID=A0A0P0VKR3_ORYSJ|nr:Os02g0575350 [Oryza sativa Japonica Group]
MPGQTYSHIGSLGRTGGGSGRRTQAKVGLASSAVEAVSNSADRFIRVRLTAALATSAGPLRHAISAAGATSCGGGSLQRGTPAKGELGRLPRRSGSQAPTAVRRLRRTRQED